MAVRTLRAVSEIHGGAATRALHGLNAFAQLLNFRRRKGADEILFLEKFQERDEVPVLAGAMPVNKVHTPRHVVCERHLGAARGAGKHLGKARCSRRRMLADKLHQLQGRSGRKLQVLVLVKPERLAWRAYINRKLSS